MAFTYDTHCTASIKVDALTAQNEWESSPVSAEDEQVTEDILMAIAEDDVDALEAAALRLPALSLSLFSMTVLFNDVPGSKPLSLLRAAQKLEARKVCAFIIGEGLPVSDPECLAALSQWMDEAAASSQANTQQLAIQDATLADSMRPQSFDDIFDLLDLVTDIEANIGEPCQLRAMCMQLCRDYMQAHGHDFCVGFDNYGETLH